VLAWSEGQLAIKRGITGRPGHDHDEPSSFYTSGTRRMERAQREAERGFRGGSRRFER